LRKRKLHTERRITIDEDSIVLDDKTVIYSRLDTSDEVFFWCYESKFLAEMSKNEIRLVFLLARMAQYNTNIISLSEYFLKEISKNLLVDVRWIKRGISSMVDKKILFPLDKVTYRVSPLCFWRGGSKERLKVMKYMVQDGII
jgi:hypothetical protein